MLRIARNDASYVTFLDAHDEYCHSKHIPREAPFAKILEKLRAHEETKPVGLLSARFPDPGAISDNLCFVESNPRRVFEYARRDQGRD
jgi:hypothetical protein